MHQGILPSGHAGKGAATNISGGSIFLNFYIG